MEIVKSVTKYIIIIIIGIGLAFFVALMEHESTDLAASVLSLTEQEYFESTNRDAGYKKSDQIFELFLSEQTRNKGLLTISLLYSQNNFEWLLDDLTSNCSTQITSQEDGNLILQIQGYDNLDFSEGIFQLPYSGDYKDITLEYVKSENDIFSIGNLDNINDQTH